MTTIDPATCWVPVPVRWRYVQVLDVVVGKAAGLLYVERISFPDGQRWIHLTGYPQPFPVDSDEMVSILVPVPERDARSLLLEDLATHVIGRRTVGAA